MHSKAFDYKTRLFKFNFNIDSTLIGNYFSVPNLAVQLSILFIRTLKLIKSMKNTPESMAQLFLTNHQPFGLQDHVSAADCILFIIFFASKL